ncbi:hypothetical protein IV203_034188 [Nitzschia inconspicua]|uniref:Uncharacterized protein n=1 Tax=Nitzschia inconspicua TaxID=303405 RepID=A0A9K3M442_9STRA|nr:hypothetical protein IV203_034188 [Nitzschia inconspicua]
MPGAARSCENQCGYFFKTLILLMTMAAVGLGTAACFQCKFLLVDLTTGTGWDVILDFIPDEFTSVWVGVFQWVPALNGEAIGECRSYDSFFPPDSQYLQVAQGCAIAAPIIGFVGVMISCFELICCSFFASCIFSFIFFFSASGVQMGVFGLLALPGWCGDADSQDCYEGHIDAITFWLFVLAGFFYFISSLLLCCVPRPDPCLQNRRSEDHEVATKENDQGAVEEPEIQQSPHYGDEPHYVETY